jgi:NitT/TauT family transport system permease protein
MTGLSALKGASIATGPLHRPAFRDGAATLLVVLVLLLAMEIFSRFVPDYIMPSPLAVARAAYQLALSDYWHVVVTLGGCLRRSCSR